MFSNLENKHVEQIYDLQINNADEFGNNIWSRLEINDLIKKKGFYSNIFLEQRRVEAFGLFFEAYNFLDLHSLFVSPMFRKRGIATAIVDSAVNHCKKKNLNPLEARKFVDFEAKKASLIFDAKILSPNEVTNVIHNLSNGYAVSDLELLD